MGARNWLPSKQADLITFMENFSSLILANPATYGLSAGDANAIATNVTTAAGNYALAASSDTRTPINVNAKDTAINVAVATVRKYGAIIRDNYGISDDLKTGLGITVRDLHPTRVAIPLTNPLISVVGTTPGQITLKARDSAAGDKVKAKPAGVKFMELAGASSATVVTDAGTLPIQKLTTRTPLFFATTPADSGKTVYLAGRWINTTGEPGPWSPIVTAVAP